MNPMIPMPIVAIWMRSLGPAALDGSTVGLSSWMSSARAVVVKVGAAEAAATDMRNDRRESRRGWGIVCSRVDGLMEESDLGEGTRSRSIISIRASRAERKAVLPDRTEPSILAGVRPPGVESRGVKAPSVWGCSFVHRDRARYPIAKLPRAAIQ